MLTSKGTGRPANDTGLIGAKECDDGAARLEFGTVFPVSHQPAFVSHLSNLGSELPQGRERGLITQLGTNPVLESKTRRAG